jgi:hypothetical protein
VGEKVAYIDSCDALNGTVEGREVKFLSFREQLTCPFVLYAPTNIRIMKWKGTGSECHKQHRVLFWDSVEPVSRLTAGSRAMNKCPFKYKVCVKPLKHSGNYMSHLL